MSTIPRDANGIKSKIVETEIQISAMAIAFGEVLTEPLSLRQLADYFEVGKKKAALIVANMGDAVERLDRVSYASPRRSSRSLRARQESSPARLALVSSSKDSRGHRRAREARRGLCHPHISEPESVLTRCGHARSSLEEWD